MPANPDSAPAEDKATPFSFRRMGGLDQVLLHTDEEWRHLDKLDPKLWMTLSCPTQGLEFDARTLELLDTDQDGRIRSADILEAVAWLCERLKHPARLTEGTTGLPLDNIQDDNAQGSELLSAARLVLKKNQNADAAQVTPDEAQKAVAAAAEYALNGDGVVPADSVDAKDDATKRFILAGFSVIGAMRDDSGRPGLNQALADAFLDRLRAARDWRQSVRQADLPLGSQTDAAWTLLQRLRPKIDDYFYRCRMAAYAPQALSALNEDAMLTPPDNGGQILLSLDVLARLPLARIAPDQPLSLTSGINPAWAEDLKNFSQLFAPLLRLHPEEKSAPKGDAPAAGDQAGGSLSETVWREILDRFAPYAALLDQKPSYERPPDNAKQTDFPGLPPLVLAPEDDALQRAFLPPSPEDALDKISSEEMETLLSEATQKAFAACVQRDLAAPRMAAVRDLEKLTLFHVHLYTLLMNFVSFADFYDPDKRAIFLAGTLYLDSRACYLCVPVNDLAAHVRLASQSHLCLLYCQCTRTLATGEQQSMTIAAALTAGNTDALLEGRHGVFVDNAEQDWDTTLTRLVHNPISLRQAMWAPYLRFGAMVADQLQKFVASKEDAISKASSKAVNALGADIKKDAAAASAGTPPKLNFDFAKGAGIFAAFSVGISVLSAAFAYIANSLLSLGWWWPMALVALFLGISGPSVILAWFKLRRRSLGPLLDASGWAVNNGAPINIAMGATLTAESSLPPGALRSLDDPYSLPAQLRRKKRSWRLPALLLAVVLLLSGAFFLWLHFGTPPGWLASWLPSFK
ncbi:ABC transporter permease [Desulfovibrio sp. ZJ369]|uniref:ABC transporter permease n=1 Tax=Desulfovibrio sp. ZJ369 TaxID=2709793 RepID=UPI001F14AAA3|nr:ABC transporter permease [Desulfovibrio sp. ZJ369]